MPVKKDHKINWRLVWKQFERWSDKGAWKDWDQQKRQIRRLVTAELNK